MKAVIHHAEIALKGKKRSFFENKLVENIMAIFRRENIPVESLKKEEGRIICSFKANAENGKIEQSLKKIFGIKYFAFVEESESRVKPILEKSKEIIKGLKNENKKSISLLTRRSDKGFPLTSIELNKEIGEEARKLGIKIDFKNPEERLFLEITSKKTYIYSKKINGLAGLPVAASGKVLALLSGGIDSPVASWLAMKRGCRVDLVHFHAFKDNEAVLKTKIKDIVDKLNKYQLSSDLFLAPYYNYQLNTLGKIPEKLDLVIFKNFMMQVSQEIALKHGHKAIVTGDSLGQVASQTIENIHATSCNINLPILRPLISYDKEEIISLAKKIGTYEDSIKPYKDCCSLLSRKPATAARVHEVENLVKKYNLKEIVKKSLTEISRIKVN